MVSAVTSLWWLWNKFYLPTFRCIGVQMFVCSLWGCTNRLERPFPVPLPSGMAIQIRSRGPGLTLNHRVPWLLHCSRNNRFYFLPLSLSLFFFIVNVKQTFISGAKPRDMLVKTVARLLYRFLPTKWVGKGCSDPLTLPTSLPNSFGLRVSSISPPLSGHYCACPVINAFCERLHCRQLALGKSATRASQPD